MDPFCWPVRVYYEDTDAGGVVYYANYLKFLERARTEWLRSLGVDQARLMAEDRRIFVIVSVQIDYLKPARFNDELTVTVQASDIRKLSLWFDQEVRRGAADGELLCRARVKAACLDADSMRPSVIPAHLFREDRP